MTIEENILRHDRKNHYTDHDINHHLKDGVFWWTDYEEFSKDMLDQLNEPEEIPAMWAALDTAEIDGTTYHYEVAL